ncbi:sensor histidine kinase [Paenibacillus humicola]|uniref:sensor histidine kinase n=1 Tax=Paenibacillus humicola TaxID=3110540 RepID=UPI00237A4C8B|nr:histidine kinase [Paenibacillus humicola]
MPQYNLFKKMVVLLLIMLVPIVGLYFYSNQTSTRVLRSELNRSNTNQLVFFQNQVNANMDNLALWPNLLIQDPDILSLKDIYSYERYLDLDTITLVKRIQTKLNIQESSSNWRSSLFIYSPALRRVITVNDVRRYDEQELKKRLKPGWQVIRTGNPGQEAYKFSLITVYPYSDLPHPENADIIIEVQFDSASIQDMLDKFKSAGRSDPLLYKKGTGTIYNRTADRKLADRLVAALSADKLQDESRTIRLGGSSYLVNVVSSETTGWYLIDYMPLATIVKPIEQTNRLFYYAVGCLLLMSCLAAYLLYAQVQVPLKRLVHSFQRLKNGDYSVRLTGRGPGEFGFVFTRFNMMVEQIQDLFEKVLMEKIHVREARLKQLQSQINPHFFYNCFSFISSMAKLRNHGAVVAMAENLSRYYRYTTRQERELVPLAEELDFVSSYLSIQNMRMSRLQGEIDIPLRMRRLSIPPLVLQPLVENAVIHGIERRANAGRIRIAGEYAEGEFRISVEDDGAGMSEADRELLKRKLGMPMDEEMGCGLWNVHQRLQLRFGQRAGLELDQSPLGGIKATIAWTTREQSETDGESA